MATFCGLGSTSWLKNCDLRGHARPNERNNENDATAGPRLRGLQRRRREDGSVAGEGGVSHMSDFGIECWTVLGWFICQAVARRMRPQIDFVSYVVFEFSVIFVFYVVLVL